MKKHDLPTETYRSQNTVRVRDRPPCYAKTGPASLSPNLSFGKCVTCTGLMRHTTPLKLLKVRSGHRFMIRAPQPTTLQYRRWKSKLLWMNEEDRQEAKMLRSMSSQEAAEWIMRTHRFVPPTLSCRSWERRDQVVLLRHYFPDRFGFSSAGSLRQFLSFMSVRLFGKIVLTEVERISQEDLALLCYYLPGVLKEKIRSVAENRAGDDLLDFLNAKLSTDFSQTPDRTIH